jgi:transcriptional regulator
MVDRYEKNSRSPIKIENFSNGFSQKEIKGIVGFKIKIEKWEAAFKISQNRDKKNQDNIINELTKINNQGAAELAEKMRKLD